MKPIKKFSMISDETSRIMESLKEAHGPALLDIVKKLGYNSLEEISKQKSILTKLESLLKEIPGAKEVSEDEADDIEDEVVKRGTPKDASDKAGEKEEDKEPGASNKVEEDDADDIEAAVIKRGTPKSLEDEEGEKEEDGEVGGSNTEVAEEEESEETKEDEKEESKEEQEKEDKEGTEEEIKGEEKETPKATRKIMTFEDFIKEEETSNKNVNYNDDEKDEDDAELDAASADPLAEDEKVDASGLAIPLETGDGSKTAEEIEDEKMKMGEPEKHNDAEGETLVTKDQNVTSKVTGTGSIIKSFAAFIKEAEQVDASGLAIPLVTGDGSKTAEEIEDEKMKMGEVDKLKDAEGKVFVTKDQVVTEDPKTSKDEPANVVVEAEMNEEEVSSDAEFKEYATTILKKAFGDKFDETEANKVIDGLTKKYEGDYGAMVGALQSSLD